MERRRTSDKIACAWHRIASHRLASLRFASHPSFFLRVISTHNRRVMIGTGRRGTRRDAETERNSERNAFVRAGHWTRGDAARREATVKLCESKCRNGTDRNGIESSESHATRRAFGRTIRVGVAASLLEGFILTRENETKRNEMRTKRIESKLNEKRTSCCAATSSDDVGDEGKLNLSCSSLSSPSALLCSAPLFAATRRGGEAEGLGAGAPLLNPQSQSPRR